MKNVKQFYRELGKLVYAVAMADGSIQSEERHKLHEFVIKELAANEPDSDSSGMNKAFYVDFEFENSELQQQNLTDSLKSFTRFIHDNYEQEDHELMQRAVRLLESVANAYTRKKEKDIIDVVKEKISELSSNG